MNCKELINRLRVYVFNQVSTKELSENELYKPKGKLSVCHISAKGNGNAGDDVLAVVLRDLFNQLGGKKVLQILCGAMYKQVDSAKI